MEISFEKILSLVKQLPEEQKVQLSQELEKEAVQSRLSQLLSIFRTDELSQKTIDEEIEDIRKSRYEEHKGHI